YLMSLSSSTILRRHSKERSSSLRRMRPHEAFELLSSWTTARRWNYCSLMTHHREKQRRTGLRYTAPHPTGGVEIRGRGPRVTLAVPIHRNSPRAKLCRRSAAC